MILVGNKADLNDERTVSYQEAEYYAKQLQIPLFLECSAKTAHNVDQIFIELSRLCITYRRTGSMTVSSETTSGTKCMIL
jgi:GTPase SAR1 family protein